MLEAKVKFVVKTSSKLAMGMANLNVVLGSQNCVFDKVGIGFKPLFKKKTRKFSSFFKLAASIPHVLKPVSTIYTKVIL